MLDKMVNFLQYSKLADILLILFQMNEFIKFIKYQLSRSKKRQIKRFNFLKF